MNDWNEKKLDTELEALMEDLPMEDPNQLEKKIEQGINRRIRKIAFRTVMSIISIALILLLIINPLANAMYINPYTLNQEPDQTMLKIFRAYFETTQPYAEPVYLEVTKKGLGCYDMEMQIVNHRGSVNLYSPNVWLELNRNEYENFTGATNYFTHVVNKFECDWNDQEEMIASFKELPASAVIYLSIADKEVKNVDELKSEDILLDWIQVYQPGVRFQGGLRMGMTCAYTENDSRNQMTGEELKEVYLSNLEFLLENSFIWHKLDLHDGHSYVYTNDILTNNGEFGILSETYENAKNLETLETKYYSFSGTRDQVIAYLEKIETTSIYVEEVALSKWN